MAGGFTLGVEEEYHLVDAETFALRNEGHVVVPATRELLGEHAQEEIGATQLEISTPVCTTLAEVRGELRRARAAADSAAGRSGCRILAAATHPFGSWHDQQLTPRERYHALYERWGLLALQQTITGCHVHVGVSDPELVVALMDRARPYLPVLLAMTGSSPYWEGVDTGYSSYRTQWYSRWPVAGAPEAMGSRAAYDDLVRELVATGIIDDASHLYWDLRPSKRFPTLEFRIGDVCPCLDDVVLHVGLVRSLVRLLAGRVERGSPVPALRTETLRAARWRAARYGLDDRLMHPEKLTLAPAVDVVLDLLDLLRPDLEEHGEWDEMSALTAALLGRGTSAARQRKALADTGNLVSVTALLVAETLA